LIEIKNLKKWQTRLKVHCEIRAHTFGIAANVEKEIRPIAGVSAVIISQSLIASHFLGLAVSATIIVNFASSRGRVETERMFANGRLVFGTRGNYALNHHNQG